MRIIRQRRPDRYTLLDNRAINDRRLSLRALGLLTWLLSRPDGWETNSERLSQQHKEGRDAIRTALGEMKAAGYLVSERRQNHVTGRWSTVWTLRDDPDSPTTGFQSSGTRPSGTRPSVNQSSLATTEEQLPKPSTEPSIHSADAGSTAVDRDSDYVGTDASAGRDLGLGMDGSKKKPNPNPNPNPWKDLQADYEAGEISDEYVEEFITEMVGPPLDAVEQSTLLGMLANGAKLIVIYNKIRKDRRAS